MGKTLQVRLLAGTAVPLILIASTAAQAQCNLGGTIGGGGETFISFIAATSNAVTSAVTAGNTAFQTQTSAFLSSPSGNPDQSASGIWTRAIGGRVDNDTVSTGTRTRPQAPTGPFAVNCTIRSQNDYSGVQGGFDIGRLNFGASGWNAHLGVTGGYFETEGHSQQGGGVTRAEVPFVGLYAALFNDKGFYLDAQVATQFYKLSVSEPSIAASGSTNATGLSVQSTAGYNWKVGDYFIEPSVGVVYSNTKSDPLAFAPTVVGVAAVRTLPTVVNLSDIETVLGRVGVRFGTTIVTGRVAVQPFAGVTLWHEFANNTSLAATFTPPRDLAGATAGVNLSSTRIGTFGQYSMGVVGSVLGTPWLSYARIDYRKGENIESLSVNGGLRYQIAPDPAQASAAAATSRASSRILTKAPPAPPPSTWTGFYVGGFGGGAWGDTISAVELLPVYNVTGSTATYKLGSSATAGLTFGYNYQLGAALLGFEAEGGYLRVRGNGAFAVSPETTSSAGVGDWYTLLAGRVGYAAGPVVFYAKGGGALIGTTTQDIDACITAPCNVKIVSATGHNPVRLTWTVGGGLEYAFGNNWSIKGEYLVLGTEDKQVASGPGLTLPAVPGTNVQQFNWQHQISNVQTAKLGLNYQFR